MISIHYSCHIYRGSSIESDDNCGTCDGAGCDACRKYFTVEGFDTRFYDPAKAEKAEESINSLVPNVDFLNNNKFFIKDDELYYTDWIFGTGYIDISCNKNSSIYHSKLEEVRSRHNRYQECVCKNKESADCGECGKYGCIDHSCFTEMKNGGRTEKKWYL